MRNEILLLAALVLLLASCGATPEPITQTRAVDGMVMVYVPAGEFPMGTSDAQIDAMLRENPYWERSWFSDEQPQHKVYLDAYWIDRTEVTSAQYAAFLNEQGNQEEGGVTWLDLAAEACKIERAGGAFRPKSGYADYPVVEVSWYGAAAYCAWAGVQLPSEAQWEKAARGTDGRVYPWGNKFNGELLNYCDASCSDPMSRDRHYNDGYEGRAPVGSYPGGAGPYGALDMAGNVREWVADWYDSGYYGRSPSENPTGPATGEYHVQRGGAWSTGQEDARAASRWWVGPASMVHAWIVGFRCVVPSR